MRERDLHTREFSQPVSSLFDEEARPRNGPTQWVSAPQLSSTRQAAPRTRPSLPSQPLRISSSCSIPSYDTLHIIFLAICREGSPALARRVGMPRKVRRSKASTHHHSKSDGDEKLEFAGWENPLMKGRTYHFEDRIYCRLGRRGTGFSTAVVAEAGWRIGRSGRHREEVR